MKYPLFIIGLLLLVIFSSCQNSLKEDDIEYEAIKSELDVSEKSIEFSHEAQNKTIHIACKGYWTATTSADWVMLNAGSGKRDAALSIKVKEHTSIRDRRSAVLTISDGIKTVAVNISQLPSTEKITASESELSFTYKGGTADVDVESNVNWTAKTDAKWFTLSYSSTELTVKAKENLSYSPRAATITIEGTKQTVSISVSQKGASEPSIKAMSVSSITQASATCAFSYSSSDVAISRYGVCYSQTDENPTTNNDCKYTQISSYGGTAVLSLTNLTHNTTYYVRPYVTTSIGTTYGSVAQFSTVKINSPEEGDNPTPNY